MTPFWNLAPCLGGFRQGSKTASPVVKNNIKLPNKDLFSKFLFATVGYVSYDPISVVTGLIQGPISFLTLQYVGYSPTCVVTGLIQAHSISQWKWLTYLFSSLSEGHRILSTMESQNFPLRSNNLSVWGHSFWIKEIKKILIQKLFSPHLCFCAMTTISYTQPLLTKLII